MLYLCVTTVVMFLDIHSRMLNKDVQFEERSSASTQMTGKIVFTGVPHIVIGRQILNCSYRQKKTSKNQEVESQVCVPTRFRALRPNSV